MCSGYLIREDEDSGVKSLLYADDIPLDKILIETDGPFMFPQPEKAVFRPGTSIVANKKILARMF